MTASAVTGPTGGVPPEQLSVQLYTLRAAFERDPAATLAQVADLGFGCVEPYGLVEHADALSALAATGLRAPTAHARLLGADLPAVWAAAARLGVGTVVEPYVAPEHWRHTTDVLRTADALNAVAEEAAVQGVRIGYHNHSAELGLLDGRHGLEVLADALDPRVVLEVDTYWALAGGADVPALLQRLGDRLAAVHVKDGDGSLDVRRQVAVGQGVLPVWEVLAAAPQALRVVELDDTEGDVLAAVRASREFLLAGPPAA